MKAAHSLLRSILPIILLSLLLAACAPAAPQVITGDPRDYLLETADLSTKATYFIPEGEKISVPNEMAISAFGKDAGEALVRETERISAGRVHYQSSEATTTAPQVYLATVVIHQTAAAAQKAVEQYNIAALYPDGGWKVSDEKLNLGDKSLVEIGETMDQSGRKATSIRVEFAYRNASADVMVFGMQDVVTVSTAEKAARAVLARLQSAPLSSGPIATMTPLTQ
jgi:hypothetical protein